MSENKEFQGIDFTELATRWGIPLDESDKNEDEQISSFIYSKIVNEDITKYYDDCVEFLKKLIINSNKHTYDGPLFEGLLKIEDKQTFMLWIARLLPYLWV